MAASGTTRTAMDMMRCERVFTCRMMQGRASTRVPRRRRDAISRRCHCRRLHRAHHDADLRAPRRSARTSTTRTAVVAPAAADASCRRSSSATGRSSRCAHAYRRGPRRRSAERVASTAPRLVSAADLARRSWWIPAAAVWSDADGDEQPQHPWPSAWPPIAAGRSPCSPASATASAGRPTSPASAGGRCPCCDGHRRRPATAPPSTTAGSATTSRPCVVVGDAVVRWGAGRRSRRRTAGPCSATTAASATAARAGRPRSRAGRRRARRRRRRPRHAAASSGPACSACRCSSLAPSHDAGTAVGRRPGELIRVAAVVSGPIEPPVRTCEVVRPPFARRDGTVQVATLRRHPQRVSGVVAMLSHGHDALDVPVRGRTPRHRLARPGLRRADRPPVRDRPRRLDLPSIA